MNYVDYIDDRGIVVGRYEATTGTAGRADLTSEGSTTVRLDGGGPFRGVVQKGRSFQRANPHVRVLVDRGRHLIVELPRGIELHEEPGCFAVIPEGERLSFQLDRAEAASRRSDVSEIAGRVTVDDLRSKVEALASLHARHSLLPGFEPALAMAAEWLAAAGCDVHRAPFPMPGGTSANLIGDKTGVAASRRLFIVCAHLDSVNHDTGPDGRAPGADDNATGSVTVAAIALALAAEQLRDDVRFVLFGGEEQGLFGSKAFVAALSTQDRARLDGVVNVDMAGSKNTQAPSVLLEGAAVSRAVMTALSQAAATYTGLETQLSLNPFASDHVPFIQKGLPAVLTIEGADDAFPHEHTARDTPDRLDFELHREITRMNLAWLLEQTLPQ